MSERGIVKEVLSSAVSRSLDSLLSSALLPTLSLLCLFALLAMAASVSQHSAANQKERSKPNTGRLSQESFLADIGYAAVCQTSSQAIRRSCSDG